MLPITESLITNRGNRPFKKLQSLKGIIIHWTANTGKGADADAHYRLFERDSRSASAHYFVDEHQIVQIIPDDEVAYHVGSRSYTAIGEQIRSSGFSPNHFLIGIEMCVNEDGNWDRTYKNTVELTQYLMQKHGLTKDQLWRHYDITGKDCPRMMCKAEDEAWDRFKRAVKSNDFGSSKAIGKGRVNASTLNVRQGNASFFSKVKTLSYGEEVEIFESVGTWYRIGEGQWVAKSFLTAQIKEENVDQLPLGKVNVARLNVRSGPSTRFDIVDSLKRDAEVRIYTESGDWYHIGENRWVHKNFIERTKINARKGIVNAEALNVRKGAGTNQTRVGRLKRNDEVEILEERNGWYRIGKDQWVYAMFIIEKLEKKAKVTAGSLNVRTGPGTSFGVTNRLKRNDSISIYGEDGDWYNIGTDAWVHRNYVEVEQL